MEMSSMKRIMILMMMNTKMKDFYYQIKGKRGTEENNGFSPWVFPPIFSGKVTAKDKKEARELINEEYGKNFPLRVLHKDLEGNDFLLSIEEIKEESHLQKLFEPQKCEQCSNTFYVIDKYNDHNCRNKGYTFCSDICKDENGKMSQFGKMHEDLINRSAVSVIYKITNKTTGLFYIGKTSQVFTLRWYQHFFQGGNNKFHEAIRKSKISDCLFEIHEIIEFPENLREDKNLRTYLADREKFILERERYWINYFNSIENGYNSI
jgi:hypothetical protein